MCTSDPDRDHVCDDDEVDRVEVGVFDPVSKRAVLVLTQDDPEFSEATLTGLLRREERSVDDAQTTVGLDYADLDIDVSDSYVLDESVPPGTAPLAFVLVVPRRHRRDLPRRLAGGYLIYRRSGAAPAPSTRSSRATASLRVTGMVDADRSEHLREAPGDLVQFRARADRPAGAPPAGANADEAGGTPDSALIVGRLTSRASPGSELHAVLGG